LQGKTVSVKQVKSQARLPDDPVACLLAISTSACTGGPRRVARQPNRLAVACRPSLLIFSPEDH
jgi:hypothetical protein